MTDGPLPPQNLLYGVFSVCVASIQILAHMFTNFIYYIIHFRIGRLTLALVLHYKQCGRNTNEPRSEKTGLRGFRPGPTQTRLYSSRRWLED